MLNQIPPWMPAAQIGIHSRLSIHHRPSDAQDVVVASMYEAIVLPQLVFQVLLEAII